MSKLLLLLKKLGWPQVSKIRRISGTDFVHLRGLGEKLLSRAHLTCQIGLPDIPDAKKRAIRAGGRGPIWQSNTIHTHRFSR